MLEHEARYRCVMLEACRIFGVSEEDLAGDERRKPMVAARAAISYVCQLTAAGMHTGQLATLLRGSENARATVLDGRGRWIRAMAERAWPGVEVDVERATVALIHAWHRCPDVDGEGGIGGVGGGGGGLG